MNNKIIESEQEGSFSSGKSMSTHYSLRSELAQEIIARQPGFIENWSLFIFLVILIAMLGATWFVHYPDIINSKAILTAEIAPKELVIKQEGRLTKLFIHNSAEVRRGDILGWIESNADHQQVLNLAKILDSSLILLNANKADRVFELYDQKLSNLGEIQPAFQQFVLAKQTFKDYTLNGFYLRKLNMLENDIKSLNDLNKNLVKQRNLTEEDLGLAKETYDINKILLDKKVITVAEYRNGKSIYVNKEKTVPQLDVSLFTNDMQKRDKLKEIEQLSHDMSQQQIIFQQEIQLLSSKVHDWINIYVLLAPIDGKVVYNTSLQENRYLRAGTLIGYVNPKESKFYAETTLSQINFGKIKLGMQVQLRFDAYPYEEWGYIDGTLSYVSNVPLDSGFLAIITLNNGLVTNNNKKLIYKNGLRANSLIITKDMRLLERFYYSFIKSTSIEAK